MTFVNQVTTYVSPNHPWFTAEELRKVIVDMPDSATAMAGIGEEGGAETATVYPWKTVGELRSIIDDQPDDYIVRIPELNPNYPVLHVYGRAALRITQEDVFGQIVRYAVAEPEVSVPRLKREHRGDVWADATGLIWYFKNGKFRSDDSAADVSTDFGPFKRCVRA